MYRGRNNRRTTTWAANDRERIDSLVRDCARGISVAEHRRTRFGRRIGRRWSKSKSAGAKKVGTSRVGRVVTTYVPLLSPAVCCTRRPCGKEKWRGGCSCVVGIGRPKVATTVISIRQQQHTFFTCTRAEREI